MKPLLALGLLLLVACSTIVPAAIPAAMGSVPEPLPHSVAAATPVSPAGLPPDPVSYSAMGDSITTAYDANSSLVDLGEQPYYSYAVGWNTSVDSFESRLLALYGPGSVTDHLLAVPGDVASDLIHQALEAVANHSGFVSILIGGNDVCASSGGVADPTPVWNFSASLNHTFRILRNALGNKTIITLANVVDVPNLWTLFGANTVADGVWGSVCPGLTSASGRATMSYFVQAYNHIEQSIVKVYNVTPWEIGNLSFTAAMVNTLDYFHPSPLGHQIIAQEWWSLLPYAQGLPELTASPALPSSIPVGTPLPITVGGFDAVPMTATVTYKETGAFFWATTTLPLTGGTLHNGTFGGSLPYNATSLVGTLSLFVTITDTEGATVLWPSPSVGGLATLDVTAPGSGGAGAVLAGVDLSPSQVTLRPGQSWTLVANATTANHTLLTTGVTYSWTLAPANLGLLIPEADGSVALLVPGESPGNATVKVTASSGEVSVTATASLEISESSGATGPSGPPAGTGPAASGSVPAPGALAADAFVLIPAAVLGVALAIGLLLRRHYLRPPPVPQPRA